MQPSHTCSKNRICNQNGSGDSGSPVIHTDQMIIKNPGTPTVKGVKVPASAKQIERPIAVFGLVLSAQVPRARSLSCAFKLW